MRCTSGDVEAQFVINCAGPGAADVAGDDALTLDTERGDFVVFGQEATILTDHVLRAVPAGGVSPMIFPTIHGRLGAAVASPSSAAGGEDSRAAWTAALQSKAAKLVPKLTGFTPEDGWSCDDAVGKGRTLVAEWSKRIPAMYNVASLGRSGLTLALGLSAYVLDRCRERGLAVQARTARTGRGQEPAFPWWQRRRR